MDSSWSNWTNALQVVTASSAVRSSTSATAPTLISKFHRHDVQVHSCLQHKINNSWRENLLAVLQWRWGFDKTRVKPPINRRSDHCIFNMIVQLDVLNRRSADAILPWEQMLLFKRISVCKIHLLHLINNEVVSGPVHQLCNYIFLYSRVCLMFLLRSCVQVERCLCLVCRTDSLL